MTESLGLIASREVENQPEPLSCTSDSAFSDISGTCIDVRKEPEADIELSCVKHGALFLNRRSLLLERWSPCSLN